MSHLPPEICDHIVDLLHGEPETLKACCLVSKSWVSCARNHLFGEVAFRSLNDLKAWEETFPDPANSPACHTRSLFIACAQDIPTAVVGEGSWIDEFSSVVRLSVLSAHEACSASQLIKLVCSLPLLEDLDVAGQVVDDHKDDGTITQFPTSPPLTGTLKLDLVQGIEAITRQLLELPNGIHFRMLKFKWYLGRDDPRWTVATMEACSGTLESIDINSTKLCEFCPFSFYGPTVGLHLRLHQGIREWVR
ncbi:hypothetical protein BJ322DRAFT_486083 [Thelephora terrestris]|uniref:F-box domain-containing protein n=1 Tax=Thelephora terrestris TaxID=56493 RepID=A0A9P6L163_9AGAM|nr:hypothetical protein BJ322DRAFT_486083 [Thelephora terrestris]